MDWGTESHEGVTCLGELCQNITNMDMPLDEDVQKFVSDGDSFAVNNPVNGIHHDSQVYEQQVQGVGYFENEQEGHGSNLEQQQAEGYGYVPYVDAEGNWQYYYGEMSSDEYKYYYECYCNYYAQYGQQEGVGGQQNDCQQHVEQQDSAIDPQFRDDLEQHGNDRGDSQSVAEEAATPVPDVAAQGVTLDEAQQAPIEGHAIRDDFAMNGDAYPPDASSVGAPDVDAIPGPSGDDVDGREVMRDVSIGDTTDEALEEAPEYLGMNLEAFVHCPTELEVPVMVAAVIEPQLGDLDLRNPASVPENSSAVPSNSRDLGTETARSLGCCTNHPEKDTSLDSWVPERDSEHAAPVESIPAEAIAPDDVQSEHPPSNPRPHRKPRERQKPKAKLAKALPWETDAAGDSQPLGSSPLRVGGMLDVDLEEDLVPLPQVPLPSQSAAPGRGMSMDHTPVQLLADAARCNEGQADSDGWDDEPSMPILANDLGQHSGTSVGSVLVGSVVVAAAAIQEQSDSITGVARTGELDDALPMPQSDADQHMQGSISSMLSRKSTHSSAADVNAAFVAEEQGMSFPHK